MRLLYPAAECHVIHTLWASATAVVLPDAPKLRFQWRVLLKFDLACRVCRGASVRLLDVVTNDTDGALVRDKLHAFLSPLDAPTLKYRAEAHLP